jgi:hypothetical protein
VLLEAAPASNPSGSSSTSSISSGYVSFQHFRLTEGVWAHNLLEYIRWCARFTMTIPLSPNNRPKPPSEHLNLDLRIPLEANPRLDIQTKDNASFPKDSATQETDQIVPNPSQEISKPNNETCCCCNCTCNPPPNLCTSWNCSAHQLVKLQS